MAEENLLELYRLKNPIIKYEYVVGCEPLNFDKIMDEITTQTYKDADLIHENELFEETEEYILIEGYKSNFKDKIDTPELRNSYLWVSSNHFYEISLFKNKFSNQL